MYRIGITALALAIGFTAAPRAEAQSQTQQVLVCRDGATVTAAFGNRACNNHGGVDVNATNQVRRNGGYPINGGTRGVYSPNGSNTGTRGVYRGGVNNGGVYNGGVYNGGVYNGGVNSNGQIQCADGKWLPAQSQGCNGHGGVANGNGRWDRNGHGGRRHHEDDGDDDDQGNGRGRDHERGGKGHGKDHHKEHGKGHGKGHD